MNVTKTHKKARRGAARSGFPLIAGIYKCPADQRPSAAGPRVRSYSMNCFVGPCDNAGGITVAGWAQFFMLSTIRNPAMVFVFVDEHPDGLNDGWMKFFPPGSDPSQRAAWRDMPASFHAGAAGFSFADGHSEIRKWKNTSTIIPVQGNNSLFSGPIPISGPTDDIAWISERGSYRQ